MSALMVAAMLAQDGSHGRAARAPKGPKKRRAWIFQRTGTREAERRRRQIERGQLRVDNGLRTEATP